MRIDVLNALQTSISQKYENYRIELYNYILLTYRRRMFQVYEDNLDKIQSLLKSYILIILKNILFACLF